MRSLPQVSVTATGPAVARDWPSLPWRFRVAAIALQLASHPRHEELIAALLLDWTEVIKANCVRSGLPAAAGHLAIPWLTVTPLARAVGLPGRIPVRSFDRTARSADLTTPATRSAGTLTPTGGRRQ